MSEPKPSYRWIFREFWFFWTIRTIPSMLVIVMGFVVLPSIVAWNLYQEGSAVGVLFCLVFILAAIFGLPYWCWARVKKMIEEHSRKGFTLVELLVVIAIIVLLLAMLIPLIGLLTAEKTTVQGVVTNKIVEGGDLYLEVDSTSMYRADEDVFNNVREKGEYSFEVKNDVITEANLIYPTAPQPPSDRETDPEQETDLEKIERIMQEHYDES